jgi:general stress protein 26
MASLEEVSLYPLDEETLDRLLSLQQICVVCWSTEDGWPVGVTHKYVWHDGRIWATASSQRHRVRALEKRPKSCVVITGDGTELGSQRTITFKTTCKIHRDKETRDWYFAAYAQQRDPNDPERQRKTIALLDTERRVVLELTPVKSISYDGAKHYEALERDGILSP